MNSYAEDTQCLSHELAPQTRTKGGWNGGISESQVCQRVVSTYIVVESRMSILGLKIMVWAITVSLSFGTPNPNPEIFQSVVAHNILCKG